jgi:NSS family neurotransmitter:Na+ symporter
LNTGYPSSILSVDTPSLYKIVPLGAIVSAIMFFWVCGKGFATKQIQIGREGKVWTWIEPLGKYVFCSITILVYILGLVLGGIG